MASACETATGELRHLKFPENNQLNDRANGLASRLDLGPSAEPVQANPMRHQSNDIHAGFGQKWVG